MSRITLIILFSFFVSGCSSLRRTGITDYNIKGEINRGKIKELNITNQDFTIQKAEIEIIKDDESQRFLITVKHRKDSTYLVIMRGRSGIEAARFYLSRDTVLINDRINSKLYYGSSDYLHGKYGISIITLPIIFGDYLGDDSENISSLQCKQGLIEAIDQIQNRKINYSIDCRWGKVKIAKSGNESENELIMFNYSKFKNINNYVFPSQVEIKDAFRNIIIRISIERIDFAELEVINFIPGKNYERILLK